VNLKVRLYFPESLVREPILARLTRTFHVEPNIRRLSIEADDTGRVVCELIGEAAELDKAVAWLRETGVRVELVGDVVES
jgi:L-aspartate semialdehyde sulfurtransferase ferredoxin